MFGKLLISLIKKFPADLWMALLTLQMNGFFFLIENFFSDGSKTINLFA